MSYNYVRKLKKEKRINDISNWIDRFYLENGCIPSYNTISNHFQISRTTTYALMAEINRQKDYKGIPYENSDLPLRTMSMDKKTHAKTKTNSDISSSRSESESKTTD